MTINWLAILGASLVTLPVGFIWYSKNVFGTIWMKETGITEESAKNANMLKVFGLTILFSFLMAFILMPMVIHQFGALGMVGGNPENVKPSYDAFMADYGTAYRTFKHGMFHGAMVGIFLILPAIGINAQFENKSWKYILINAGYFIVTLTLQGGILCAWA